MTNQTEIEHVETADTLQEGSSVEYDGAEHTVVDDSMFQVTLEAPDGRTFTADKRNVDTSKATA